MPQYTVAEGDCVMSIAQKFGFFWETLWNLPDNAALKQLRQDPNILFPGDVVVIPDKTPRNESAPTEQTAKFVKKLAKAQVRLRLLDTKRQPRANIQYIATVDGVNSSGQSDSDGYITLQALPNSKQVNLKLTDSTKTEQYSLPLGSLDPIEKLSGVQQRLTNLGYSCVSEQGTMGNLTKSAILAFQKERGLNASGELDDNTRQSLAQVHGT